MDIQVADALLGSLVDGRYRIRGRVARGGVATVYVATDERLERTVALKIIHPNQAPDIEADLPSFLTRFTDEAKTVARLTHPNVVAVYDQGTHAGMPYLVMEYVRGRTLREVMAGRHRLQPDETLAIMEQMLAALSAAHRAGLVHRDVKPENVLVAEAPSGGPNNLVDSVVKVADFGLARAVEASSQDSGGQLMATAAYVAPELVAQGRGDPRSDVYSAGIVLFEMLTGRVPYDDGRPVDIAWQHVDRDVPPPSTLVPGLPPAIDALVVRATRRDPSLRPTDAGALLSQVQAAREGLGSAQTSTAVLPRADVASGPLEQRTMVVSAVPADATAPDRRPWGPSDGTQTDRPPWARLPQQQPDRGRPHRRRADAPAAERLADLRDRLLGDPRSRLALAAAIVVLGLVALVGGWWYGIGRYTAAPQLVAMSAAQAQTEATRSGFTVEFGEPRHDEAVPKDVVLAQDPPPSGRVVRGGTITLTLSLGPQRLMVPDVVGKTFDLAQIDLEGAGLAATRGPDRYNDNLPEGVVMAVDPPVGTQVPPGTAITVTVSKGKSPLTVPDLVGLSINKARDKLEDLGLTAVERYKESDRPKDEVIGQDPDDGTGVEEGAEVTLDVSEGPPAVTVPRVVDMPCQQAKQVLESQQLTVAVQFNPNGTVRYQNPGENASVPPGTQVIIGCF